MPENEKAHPWPGMYGRDLQYPAYGIWLRHVKNLKMINVQIEYENTDVRPAIFLDDVMKADFVGCDFQAMGYPLKIVNSKSIVK